MPPFPTAHVAVAPRGPGAINPLRAPPPLSPTSAEEAVCRCRCQSISSSPLSLNRWGHVQKVESVKLGRKKNSDWAKFGCVFSTSICGWTFLQVFFFFFLISTEGERRIATVYLPL
jgi:hypothetical protein